MIVPTAVTLQWGYRAPGLLTPMVKITWSEGPIQTEPLWQEHTMTVMPTKQYVELIEEVVEALQNLVRDALEDYPDQDTWSDQKEDDDGDEFGSAT